MSRSLHPLSVGVLVVGPSLPALLVRHPVEANVPVVAPSRPLLPASPPRAPLHAHAILFSEPGAPLLLSFCPATRAHVLWAARLVQATKETSALGATEWPPTHGRGPVTPGPGTTATVLAPSSVPVAATAVARTPKVTDGGDKAKAAGSRARMGWLRLEGRRLCGRRPASRSRPVLAGAEEGAEGAGERDGLGDGTGTRQGETTHQCGP